MSTQTVKYPRTPHLPSSPGMTEDDKRISDAGLATLRDGRELVVTEKLDGGNLTWYRDAFHGRSLDSGTHAWDTAARALWGQVRFDIPEGWRISGESMWARRSVPYESLPGVYIVFGIWDEHQVLRPWDETVEWASLLGLPTVPLLYRGTDWNAATSAWMEQREENTSEGFVVRDAGAFAQKDFSTHIAKWVRAGHVRTRDDWRHRDDFATNTFA